MTEREKLVVAQVAAIATWEAAYQALYAARAAITAYDDAHKGEMK